VYIAYNYGGRRRRRESQIRESGISFYLPVTLSLPLSLSRSNFRVESPYRSRRRSKDNRLTDLATTKSESRPLEIQGSALRRARIKFRLIRAALLLRTAASGASKNEEFDSCGFRARQINFARLEMGVGRTARGARRLPARATALVGRSAASVANAEHDLPRCSNTCLAITLVF